MFAQVTSTVSNGLGDLKASCQEAFPTIDCGLLEKACCLCMIWLGLPPHSKAPGVILSTNKAVERKEFVFICDFSPRDMPTRQFFLMPLQEVDFQVENNGEIIVLYPSPPFHSEWVFFF